MSSALASLLPQPGASLSADEILDRFVGFAAGTGLELYPAQEEAILELLAGKHVILNTPTGSGKSLVATALHFQAMAEGKVSVYTAPTKALVNEKFFALCRDFGPDHVGMLTGDASINREAPILCCTAEVLANLCVREASPRADYVVMDEFHYYGDKERGLAWQLPLLVLERAVFLLMSATLGDVSDISRHLSAATGRELAFVHTAKRPVPLEFEYRETPLHETLEALIARGRAPVYLVNFTQRGCAEEAQNLMSVNISSKAEKEAIKATIGDFRADTPYGKELLRFLHHGVGLHHAGLLPKYRLLVEKLAQAGLLKVVSGTDTLGVGVNIPIRTVLFTKLCKFDGEKTTILSVREFRQIAGRAGRKGFDELGTVAVQAPAHVIENLKLAEKKAQGKKVVKRQPPEKGYVAWDRATFERLCERPPEPLESQFDVSFGLLLNLLQSGVPHQGGSYGRLIAILGRAHVGEGARRRLRRVAAERFRALRKAGLIGLQKQEWVRGMQVKVEPSLQRDFSLNHTLSLYLLDTLPRLDPDSETFALDVLTLVESILESPKPVLFAQLNQLKTLKVAELKAAGVEYEQRMEELDKLEWPKPNREFVYDSFNAFADRHPWVGAENIRPKSIARDLFERYCSFNDYVREYGLERSEGVLLRYLTDCYRTLVQNVPEAIRTEQVDDVIAHLRELVRSVDSSLLDEWERLRDPSFQARDAAPDRPPPAPASFDPAADPRAFAARIRAELHRVLVALARRDYAGVLAQTSVVEGSWDADQLAAALEPYWAEHATMDVTPRARQPAHTFLRSTGPRVWEVRQKIVDPEGDEDWAIECVIDLSEPRDPTLPLISLSRVGI